MEFYTLGDDFLPVETIDSFISAVWTERYSSAGDVQLIVEDTTDMKTKLTPGTFLASPETNEIMLLETHGSENGLLTVTGSSLLAFLNNRIVYEPAFLPNNKAKGYESVSGTPGGVIRSIVLNMCIDTGDSDNPAVQLDWEAENIPNLSIEPITDSGFYESWSVPLGSGVYDAIQKIAEDHSIGISLYLDSATVAGYSLKFRTYYGIDRTSEQTTNPLVRLSPHRDSLGNIKSLHSIAGWKNVAYVYAEDRSPPLKKMVSADAIVFDRRTMLVQVTDMPEGLTSEQTENWLAAQGVQALLNNNYIKVFDGEIHPQGEYEFGTHYKLGDIIELEDIEGDLKKVRVAEYIRSHDSSGEKQYPTISLYNDLVIGEGPTIVSQQS
jgi:hypothetical protein